MQSQTPHIQSRRCWKARKRLKWLRKQDAKRRRYAALVIWRRYKSWKQSRCASSTLPSDCQSQDPRPLDPISIVLPSQNENDIGLPLLGESSSALDGMLTALASAGVGGLKKPLTAASEPSTSITVAIDSGVAVDAPIGAKDPPRKLTLPPTQRPQPGKMQLKQSSSPAGGKPSITLGPVIGPRARLPGLQGKGARSAQHPACLQPLERSEARPGPLGTLLSTKSPSDARKCEALGPLRSSQSPSNPQQQQLAPVRGPTSKGKPGMLSMHQKRLIAVTPLPSSPPSS